MSFINDGNCWFRHTFRLCSPQQLSSIITQPSNGVYVLPIDSYNKVFDGIYIGDELIAGDIPLLKSLDIRHVLNAAFGSDISLNMVNICPDLYSKHKISFMGIEAIDLSTFHLLDYFETCAQFINNSLNEGGNILVHCKQGISRSATLVLSFLMLKRGLSVEEAVRIVRQNREIHPNDGFLSQLCFLNDKLEEQKQRIDL